MAVPEEFSARPCVRRADRGYDTNLALGSVAAAGSIGIMIPPSITMIIYGLLTDVSVARLFAAGLLPGLLLGALYSGFIIIRSLHRPSLAPAIEEQGLQPQLHRVAAKVEQFGRALGFST